ncbi:GNAT family N-acetyltransferase [Ensifer adhaerens]|uniref:GNAT family N-acetyltransferase n=1 Tax=Ensifer adhaerens TaxID=106592 RepID=UPI000AD560F8
MFIETPRLRLRPWEQRDVAPFAVANADPDVRRYYFPDVLTREETAAMIADCDQHLRKHGFGFVALERKADGALIGGLGLSHAGDEIPGGPHVEIGWILARPYWRQGARSGKHLPAPCLVDARACRSHRLYLAHQRAIPRAYGKARHALGSGGGFR